MDSVEHIARAEKIREIDLFEKPNAWTDALPPNGTPQSPLESQLLEIWEELLKRRDIGTRENFFELGGTLPLMTQMLELVEERSGRHLEFATIREQPTIEQIAGHLLREQRRLSAGSPLVALHPQGRLRPFFFLHGDYVGGGFFCKSLAQMIGSERPFYAVHPHGLHGDVPPRSIGVMAADRLAALRSVQPTGPYLLGGYCNGALVAFEMARLLEAEGEVVSALIMLMADGSNHRRRFLYRASHLVSCVRSEGADAAQERFLKVAIQWDFLRGFTRHYLATAWQLLRCSPVHIAQRIFGKASRIIHRLRRQAPEASPAHSRFSPNFEVSDAFFSADLNFFPRPYRGPVSLLWPQEEKPEPGCAPSYGWTAVCPSVQLLAVPGHHYSCVSQVRNVQSIGETMRAVLNQADSPADKETPL